MITAETSTLYIYKRWKLSLKERDASLASSFFILEPKAVECLLSARMFLVSVRFAESIWGKFNRSKLERLIVLQCEKITLKQCSLWINFFFVFRFGSVCFNAITESRCCLLTAIGNGKSFNSHSTRKLYWLCISSFCALIVVSLDIYVCEKIKAVD